MYTTIAITSFKADYVLLVCAHYLIKNSSLCIELIDYFKKSEIDVSISSYPFYRSTETSKCWHPRITSSEAGINTAHSTEQSFIQVGFAPTTNPLPFHIPFYGEKVPFPVSSIDKWCPFHKLSLKLCITFNCCKCIVFKIRINLKPRTFSQLFHIKSIC